MKKPSSPFFSIIIPTYNRKEFVQKAINSVFDQKFNDWELLVIDDGSTDNTSEILCSIKDERFRYYFKKNRERSVARNYGINRARGKYICFLDSDDGYFDNHLKSLYDEITSNKFKTGIYYTGMIQYRDQLIESVFYNKEKHESPFLYVWENFLLINSVCCSQEILRKYKFPEKFHIWEDTHLWLRIVLEYPIYQIEEYTTYRTIHENSTVSKMLSNIKIKYIKQHLACITDFYINNTEKVNEHILPKDVLNLKTRIIIDNYNKARKNKNIGKLFLLIILGIKYTGFKNTLRKVYLIHFKY